MRTINSTADKIDDVIWMYGVPRSGGTYLWQMIGMIAKEHRYTHDFRDVGDKKLIIIYRDFRDVVASVYRIEWLLPQSEERVKDAIHFVKEQIKILNQYKKFYKNKALYLKYEDCFGNYDYIFSKIEPFLDIKLTDKFKKEIIDYTCLETNKRRQEEYNKEIVTKTRIHSNHVGPAVPGSWKKVVPKEYHEYVEKELKPHLKKWGYK